MTDNVKAWVNELRTTTAGQVQNQLGVIRDGRDAGFCCLGLGSRLVKGINARPHWPGQITLTFNGFTSSAPPEFIEWLGLAVPGTLGVEGVDWNGFDVVLDVPKELFRTGKRTWVTASELNDEWGLTFDQIADMIEYFGLLEAVGGVDLGGDL